MAHFLTLEVMRPTPLAVAAAAATAALVVIAGPAVAGALHDDAGATTHINNAISELESAKADISAPAPTTTVTETAQPTSTPTVTVTQVVTASPSPTQPARAYPEVASVQQNSGESWADACIRTMSYGYTGCVFYMPASNPVKWGSGLAELASKVGTKPIDLQLTFKTYDRAGLQDVVNNLPAAWKAGFIANYYQEPEDNGLSPASYKAVYTDAASVLRPAGLQLPYVEFQEWTLDPANTKSWGDISYLQSMMPPAADVGGILWSMFEYNERDHVAAQVDRIKSASAQLLPGKPFAQMAGAYTLEPAPGTDTQKQAQAAWLDASFKQMKAAGSAGYAWYNVNFPGTGGAAGEGRLELNKYACATAAAICG